MDGCNAVRQEIDKVSDKFHHLNKTKSLNIGEALDKLRQLKEKIEKEKSIKKKKKDGNGRRMEEGDFRILSQNLGFVRDSCGKLSSDHRDLHTAVSRVGKCIDRNFVSDFDTCLFSRPTQDFLNSESNAAGGGGGSPASSGDPVKINYLNSVILDHFYRQGRLELTEILAKEADIVTFQTQKDPFLELNSILESLRRKDLKPALDWAYQHRSELNARDKYKTDFDDSSGSPLELRLHKLRFIEFLREDKRMEAIKYARAHFPQFVPSSHDREIQNLMGALMYSGSKLSESPYDYLLNPSLWREIEDYFVKDACALMGLALESPLSVVINAGCTALPALLNIKEVMLQRQVSGVWNAKDELPIEIDLGNSRRYHSIFACPILRQQTSVINPPLRLTCGHCISRDALNKLTNGQKLKCPYCPVEQNPNDARQISF